MSQNPPLPTDLMRNLQQQRHGVPQVIQPAEGPLLQAHQQAQQQSHQADLPLATPGIQRWVWRSRFGEMLIEVAGEEVFVNGQRVQRHVG